MTKKLKKPLAWVFVPLGFNPRVQAVALDEGNFCSRYYLFSVSNLIAAFGGGLILGKATNIIKTTYLHGGSILAFFIGSVLGLLFINLIPKKASNFCAKFFSIGCSFVSIVLYYFYQAFSINGLLSDWPAIGFFAFLCIRFSLWFYSRVIRASIAAGYQQSIAWVEFGYYAGMVLGLVFWDILDISLALPIALLVDAAFQLFAGLLDVFSFYSKNNSNKGTQTAQQPQNAESSNLCSRLSVSVILLTVGAQVVLFNAAHYLSHSISTYILASFYFGVAVSAFTCNKFKIFAIGDGGLTHLSSNTRNKPLRLSIFAALFAMAIAISAICCEIFDFMLFGYQGPVMITMVCFLTFVAAFFFETVSLVFLDKINSKDLVMQTYGLMGLFSALTFWAISMSDKNLLFSVVLVCTAVTYTVFSVVYPLRLERSPRLFSD
jgi:hypothetical protein